MFRVDGKHSNPVSCRESSTHGPIKRSVPINVDLQFHVNHLLVTHLILHSSQKQQEGRDLWGERTLRKTSGIPPALIHYPGCLSAHPCCFFTSWAECFPVLLGQATSWKLLCTRQNYRVLICITERALLCIRM